MPWHLQDKPPVICLSFKQQRACLHAWHASSPLHEQQSCRTCFQVSSRECCVRVTCSQVWFRLGRRRLMSTASIGVPPGLRYAWGPAAVSTAACKLTMMVSTRPTLRLGPVLSERCLPCMCMGGLLATGSVSRVPDTGRQEHQLSALCSPCPVFSIWPLHDCASCLQPAAKAPRQADRTAHQEALCTHPAVSKLTHARLDYCAA